MSIEADKYKPVNNVRVVTATSLFDGHDVSINIMRRILQDTGVEVIHLGHNRSVQEIVDAAVEEDAQGIAVSSYQGGHVEFFKYIVDLLKEKGADIKVFRRRRGGVIIHDEIDELEKYGVTKIYSPEDGSKLGLQGMINHMIGSMDFSTVKGYKFNGGLSSANKLYIAKMITAIETPGLDKKTIDKLKAEINAGKNKKKIPVIGITGTGGAGKSSLIDELIIRFLQDIKDIKIAIISCDPSRRKTGGALLGDRIRMNSINSDRVYMRSLATRQSNTEISAVLADAIDVVKAAGFDLVIAETAGIGQGDSKIADIVDISLYVMTGEFGAATQLEKIDMLDYADLIAVNKYEKPGSEDAVRDVRKQVQRNHKKFDRQPEDMPVFGTIASKFNDDGVTALYCAVLGLLEEKSGVKFNTRVPKTACEDFHIQDNYYTMERTRYLSEIADTVREYHKDTE